MPSRNSGKKGNEPPSRAVQVSKKLSWLLRHGAEKEGLTLNADGYINLVDVLANRNIRSLKVTYDEVRQIVADNDKQRFSMILVDPSKREALSASSASTEASDWMIRANQGHSIVVDAEGDLLTAITKDNMPITAVHGTTHANWMLIVESGGLKPMGRNHVHFASGLPAGFKTLSTDSTTDNDAAAPVISGMRSSSTIIMYLDLAKAIDAGITFGLSQNGVILTSGNEAGLVPLDYFSSIEDRTGQGILLKDGSVVKEAPSSWDKRPQKTG